MQVDTGEFRAVQDLADEAAGLRRALAWHEVIKREPELRAESRGFERGRAGRHARPRGGQHAQLRAVPGGRA
ncbi:MAG: hypothetical protein ACRDOE_13520 [Streptosporangiaceae bacterium]